ncbi:MAG TPA: magnesium/cobalt transporter CorA [Anaerolineaceae bacterium]|nr:magnesium/cobalt transporter CorA [Anaerolineaceae bacterium]HPN49942.1 magnesium/cobalt transporter CorA [Anaerolineaceae bacterium]
MIRIIYFPPTEAPSFDHTLDEIEALVNRPGAFVWVSLEKTTPEEVEQVLSNTFHFHPLSVEDCISIGYQPPKVDDFGTYIFLILHALHCTDHGEELETKELNLFLGHNYLVTSYLDEEMTPVQKTLERLQRDDRLARNGPDFLCHTILDYLVDEFMPLLDHLDEEIEELEDMVIDKPTPNILQRILSMKHVILTLRRAITPQREILNRLSRDDFPQIDRTSRIYFRDIYDHLVRIQDLLDTVRDIVGNTLDSYLSATSNRLNEVMKALTVVSTIFLPLSFIAGVYGMNFQHLPEVTWPLGYAWAWFLFISIAVTMIVIFKKRGWF